MINVNVNVTKEELFHDLRKAYKKAKKNPNRMIVFYEDDNVSISISHETRKFQIISGHGNGRIWIDRIAAYDSNGNEVFSYLFHKN